MSKILVVPDIHGRTFWKKVTEEIDNYDKVVFLGDYLDAYDFEEISNEQAIENFKEIIDFKKQHNDKVILLFGNHDMPYAFTAYFKFSSYHCRIMRNDYDTIRKLFVDNIDLFQLAYVHEDIIFTHAGIESGWLYSFIDENADINEICDAVNGLTDSDEKLRQLFKITSPRGGRDKHGSCIWADIEDMAWQFNLTRTPDAHISPIMKTKQVFGHTLQAFRDYTNKIQMGNEEVFGNYMMLDCAKVFILETENFIITKL